MIKRKICFLLSCVSFLFLSGCWDRVEIEERGFVIGSAIDLVEQKENGEYELTLTNQFVVPSALGTPASGGGSQEAFTNLSASGESMYAIERKMAQRTSRSPFLEHLKVIVVSNEVAQTPNLFADIMDIFLRNPEMRRGIKVIISEGEAKKVLDIKPPNEKLPVMYIESIMENSFKTSSVLQPVRIGEIHADLLDQNSYVIPRVTLEGEGIRYIGGAVFHGYDDKMVGLLSGEETKGLNLITGKAQEGTIEVKLDEEIITYEMEEVRSKIKIDTKNKENLSISVNINVEGTLAETFGTRSFLKKKTLAEVEKQVAKKVEEIANQTIKKAQEELKADFIGIGNRLHGRHYDLWQDIKDNWDHGENYFAKSTFHVSASAKIRATGATNQTKNKWSDK